MPNEDDVMLLKLEIDPRSLDEAFGKIKQSAEKASKKAAYTASGGGTFISPEEGRAQENTILSGSQVASIENQIAKAVLGGFETATKEQARGGVSFSGTAKTKPTSTIGGFATTSEAIATAGKYGGMQSFGGATGVKGDVKAGIGSLGFISPEEAQRLKYGALQSFSGTTSTNYMAGSLSLPEAQSKNASGLIRGILGAFRGGQGGIGSAISSVGQIGSSGFGALGLSVGAAAAVIGLWTFAVKKSLDTIDNLANKLKDFNAAIFATSTQLEYFWMGFKYRIGRQLETVLPALMEEGALMLSRLIELGVDLFEALSPAIGAILKFTTVFIDSWKVQIDVVKIVASWIMEKVGKVMAFFSGGSSKLSEEIAGNWGDTKNKAIESLNKHVLDIANDVRGIKDNTDNKEGVAIAAALFNSIRDWSRNKGKDFGDIGVGGFQKTPNAANILKDITGLKPQEDFFLNGAGAGANAKFPGPEKTTNHFKAADTIKIEFSDYDRIMFAIQNAMNEMLTKTTRSGDMRFNLLQANLARITR